jgi:N-acyl amino acid synthase of PEP-CTERM/exosortase system
MSMQTNFNSAKRNEFLISSRPLINLFRRYFTVVQANSTELLDDVFRLRFQVYCLERGFENATAYPDGRERDHEDSRSSHFLVLYRPADDVDGAAVGTVRLILPRRGADLPVVKLLSTGERRKLDLPLNSTAEVSRFAVPRSFRKRLEHDLGKSLASGAAKQALSLLNFWVIRAVTMMTADGGITHIVAMMEPALLRLLRRLGIEFHPMGRTIEHRGLRQPVWAATVNLTERIRQCRPELWEIAFDSGWEVPTRPALRYA